jgi:hypothetical protein
MLRNGWFHGFVSSFSSSASTRPSTHSPAAVTESNSYAGALQSSNRDFAPSSPAPTYSPRVIHAVRPCSIPNASSICQVARYDTCFFKTGDLRTKAGISVPAIAHKNPEKAASVESRPSGAGTAPPNPSRACAARPILYNMQTESTPAIMRAVLGLIVEASISSIC